MQSERFDESEQSGPADAPVPAKIAGNVTRLQYLNSFQYVFESPGWMMNLLAGALAIFSQSVIPIVGMLIFQGYQYEVIDSLHRRGKMPYPDFDFGKFGDYLSRGGPPFVVGLVFGFLLTPVIMFAYFGTIILVAVVIPALKATGADDAIIVTAVVTIIVLGFAMLILLVSLLSMVTMPMSLRAGLSGKIGEGFNFRFVMDFLGRTWKDMLLVYLWLSVVSMVLSLIGALLCCVGFYPAAAWYMMAGTHLTWQLYELYLTRGGEPIPLKESSG